MARELLAPFCLPRPGPQACRLPGTKAACLVPAWLHVMVRLMLCPLRAGFGPPVSWLPKTLADAGHVADAQLCSGLPPPRPASGLKLHTELSRSATSSPSQPAICPSVHPSIQQTVSKQLSGARACSVCWEQDRSPASLGLAFPLPALGSSRETRRLTLASPGGHEESMRQV